MAQLTTRQFTQLSEQPASSDVTGVLQPGDMLQDRYQIMGPLGEGGFSSVFKARDMRFPSVTKLCAVKEMVMFTADPQLREQTILSFEREASMLAMLDHPSIIDISDYFTEGDRSYLVLELIEGRNLEEWLLGTAEVLDEQKGLDWALQICSALAYLHNRKPQSVIFRDLKPSNIMLNRFGEIRLIDFGIAKVFEGNKNRGTMIGTEGYTPPEQYRGEATPAVDIYALGATLHHLLTRCDPRLETPFTFQERPIREINPQISRAFEAIIMRCVSYDPKERYPDALALNEALLVLQEAETDEVDLEKLGITQPSETAVAPVKIGVSQVKPLWTFSCEDEIRAQVAVAKVAKGIVFAAAYDNNLYAVTADKGDFLWKYPTGASIGAAPCVYEDAVFVASSDHHIYSLQLSTGRENWRFAAEGPIYASPAARYDHIFFGADDGYFYALKSHRGTLLWRAPAYGAVRSTAYLSRESVFFGTESGEIYCLAIGTGSKRWQAQAKRAVTSSPLMADDIVIVGSLDATVYAFDAGSGWPLWRFQTERPVMSSPVMSNGIVYIGSADGCLYAIDVEAGRKIWSYQTEGQIVSSPLIWNDTVFFSSTDGNIYGLSLRRGDLQWRFETGSVVIAAPYIADDVMYIGTIDHQLYALPVR